jgi:hypothetical protein
MPTYDAPTTKYGLPRLDGSSNVQDVDEGIGALADAVDANMAGYRNTRRCSRPSARAPGRATDPHPSTCPTSGAACS